MTNEQPTVLQHDDQQATRADSSHEGDVSVTLGGVMHDEPPRATYGSLWRTLPRELGFLLLTMPIAIVGLAVMSSVFFTGIGLIALVVGLFVVVGALFVARAFGTLELVRLGASGRPPIARPSWHPSSGGGFWRRTLGPMTDGHYWVYLLHGLIVNPILSVVSWSFALVWTTGALAGLTYWFWAWSLPRGDISVPRIVVEWILRRPIDADPWVLEASFNLVLGIFFALTLPFVTRAFTMLHHVIAAGMLSRWRADDLAEQVTRLDASRGAAVAAEDQAIRRLERDIHDGPQQRLIRLQMDLAAAERKLDADPDAARTLLSEATAQAHASLDELRALSRGFAPPILLDRGLLEAVRSSAAMNPLRVTFETNLNDSERLPGEIERNVYFVVSELLTNAAKHSGATDIAVKLHVTGGTPGIPRMLFVEVSDNGQGGAALIDGNGLAGLRDRVSGLNGSFTVESGSGYGTRVVASVPLP